MRTPFKMFLQASVLIVALLEMVASESMWLTARDGAKYLLENESKYNWIQAHGECARRGLQLVIIDSATKTSNLIALGKNHDLWIGHHDEFSSSRDKNRAFYSLSSGERIAYSNWNRGEPNNGGGNENCAHVIPHSGFEWNDNNCKTKLNGFLCEEHQLTTKYRKDMQQKQQAVNQKTAQLSSTFSTTQSKINGIASSTRSESDSILLDLRQTTDEIIGDLKKSIEEVVRSKPYMEAVINDLNNSLRSIVVEKKEAFAKASGDARKQLDELHATAERSTSDVTSKFSTDLSSHSNEIDKLLVF